MVVGKNRILLFILFPGSYILRNVAVREGIDNFYAYPILARDLFMPLQDLYTWYDEYGAKWGIGIESPNEAYGTSELYTIIMSVSGSGNKFSQYSPDSKTGIDWNGFMFASVYVDSSNMSDIIAYFVGYRENFSSTAFRQLSLNMVITHYQVGRGAFFTFEETDVCFLDHNLFHFYSPLDRPQIHFIGYDDLTFIIVDPPHNCMYAVAPPPYSDQVHAWDTPFVVVASTFKNMIIRYTVEASAVSKSLNWTLIAYSVLPNSVTNGAIDIKPFYKNKNAATFRYVLPFGFMPRCLIVDDPRSTAYVAVYDVGELLRMDLKTLNIIGYQRLPEGLKPWEGVDTSQYLVFTTYDANSKVFRVHKDDFCEKRCPENGFCKRGTCLCRSGFFMSYNFSCDPFLREKCSGSSEINYLFAGLAVTSLIAILGWALFFFSQCKMKKNNRGPLINIEETEEFLSASSFVN